MNESLNGRTSFQEEQVVVEQKKITAFVQLVEGFPEANMGDGEDFYEAVSQKLTPENILKLRKLIEYGGN